LIFVFNILKHVVEELAVSTYPFSTQLDETTDISQCSQLLVFGRYVQADAIKEEFLFCEFLLETTKNVDSLKMVKFSFCAKQNFDWKEKLHTVRTDEALGMLGNTSGFCHLSEKGSFSCHRHSLLFLHRYARATKTLPATLKEVLSTAIKVIHFIRSESLNHHIFKTFCQEWEQNMKCFSITQKFTGFQED
jgi:hypothetical protein